METASRVVAEEQYRDIRSYLYESLSSHEEVLVDRIHEVMYESSDASRF